MYGADWCSDCRRAKSYLDTKAVRYTYVDLEATPEAINTVMEFNGGRKSIPVVVFSDGSHLTEPSDDALAQKLGHV